MLPSEVIGPIIKFGPITSGPKPERGPISTIPFHIEAHLLDGRSAILSLSPDAAAELAEALATHLRVYGSR